MRCLAFFLILCLRLAAQSTGELTGAVTDGTGAPMANVQLRLTQTNTGVVFTGASNDSGLYRFANLTPAPYELTAKHAGFADSRLTGVVVEVNRVSRADLVLQVAATQQEVTVSASSQLLDFDSSVHGHIMNGRQIESLPLQTKNPMALVTLTPGVVTINGGAAINRQGGDGAVITSAIVVNGGVRTQQGGFNEFRVDGVSVTNRRDGTVLALPPADAVQEFQVQSGGISADFGHTVGGVISYVTKSGSNAPHGLLFENYRGTATNARRAIPATSPRPPNNYNQFGGNIGGPVYLPKLYDGRNRTFFFFNYDGNRWVRNNPATATIPTERMRAGDFSEVPSLIYDPATAAAPAALTPFPGRLIPQSRWNPVGKKILDVFPLPNSPGTANNYQGVFRVYTPHDNYAGRFDHVLSDNQRLFARAGHYLCGSNQIRTFETAAATQNVVCNSKNFTANYNYTITPNVVYGATAGYTVSRRFSTDLTGNKIGSSQFGYTVNPAPSAETNVTPGASFDIYTGLGLVSPTDQVSQSFQVNQSLSVVKRKHTLRFGADLRRYRTGGLVTAGASNGNIGFSPLQTSNGAANTGNSAASALLGLANTFNMQQTPRVRFDNDVYGLYIADDFRVSRSLTLNLGLRWDMEGKMSEIHNRAGYFDSAAIHPTVQRPGVFRYAGLDGAEDTITSGDYSNIGPRFGFAWSPAAFGGRTVVRGAFGVSYAPIPTVGGYAVAPGYDTILAPIKPSATAPAVVLATSYTLPPVSGPQGAQAYLGQGFTQPVDRYAQASTVYQWNFGIQREITKNLVAELLYGGNRGLRLMAVRSLNQAPESLIQQAIDVQAASGRPGDAQAFLNRQVPNPVAGLVPGTLGAPTRTLGSSLVQYPHFAAVNLRLNDRDSIYHSLQAKLERRLSSDLTFLLSYTFSKLIDNAVENNYSGSELSSTGVLQNPYNLRDSRATGNFDKPHVFQGSMVYALPFGKGKALASSGIAAALLGGFRLNTIVTIYTGTPLGITQTEANGLGVGGGRPDVNGDPKSASDSVRGQVNSNGTVQWISSRSFAVVNGRYGTAPIRFSQLRGPNFSQIDLGIQRDFRVREGMVFRLSAEAFNALNHTNFATPEQNVSSPAFGQVSAVWDPRVVQFGLQFRF